MTLDTFFEKFAQFADAPDAVAKMRELVLELAVKGALSERHASEQDDPAWREFIAKFDQRRSDSDIGTETPFEIPDEWRWARLDDLGTTRVRNDVEDSTRVSFVPMALISSTYGVAAQSEERTWSEIKKGFTHFADGDVVMAKITPCFENAKSAVMRNLVNGVGAGTTELHVFRRGTDLVLPEFVLLYVKTRGFITRGEPRMTGSAGQKRVPREYFATSPFPLPPLAEQKRIVAKVDELMALCDRLALQQQERETRHAALARASLARFADAPTPANLPFLFHPSYPIPPADLRKSILTLAVQGKLVPQDPNDEPAEELVRRLLAEKARLLAAGELNREKAIPPLDDASVPYGLPNGWCWSRLGDLSHCVTSGSRDWAAHYSDEGAIFVRMGNLSRNSYRLRMDKVQHVMPPSNAEGNRTRLEAGDVLISITGEVGLLGLIPDGFGEAYINQHTCLVRLPAELRNRFIPEFFRSPFAQGYFNAPQRGLKNSFRLTDVTTMPVPIPPLAEQRRIVAKVEQLMALVDTLETQLAASRATAANLLSALVAELTSA
jgi:type I restriction enzyme S subunit